MQTLYSLEYAELRIPNMDNAPHHGHMVFIRRKEKELDLYSWRRTRARSDLTCRAALQKLGKAIDVAFHLLPALCAIVLVLVAYQMAQSGEYAAGTERPATSIRTTP